MKAAITACSNAQSETYRPQNETLTALLESWGYTVEQSKYIYAAQGVFSGTGQQRAAELRRFFCDSEVEQIFDISGGDLANQVLDGLDYDCIAASKATFWGYSDLTTVINAIYTKTGKSSVLYQIKNLVWSDFSPVQQQRFLSKNELFCPDIELLQGKPVEGILVGGNIRCFLKLAGTEYFPDLTDKILLLEAYGGEVAQMTTYLTQLKQLGAFQKIRGILLGTFTAMEQKQCSPDIITLVQQIAGKDIPIARTREIGHGKDSKAIVIGKMLRLPDMP